MAHFSPDFIEQVQEKNELQEIIARHVELKRTGHRLVGLCPFHHEKTPSFSVTPDKQLYYCFGCGAGGGVIQFIMHMEGFSFPETIRYLAERVGLELPADDAADQVDQSRLKQGYDYLAKVHQAMVRALHASEGEAARRYLQQRQFPEQAIATYQLGYAPKGYGFVQKVLGDHALDLASECGLLFKNDHGSYADRFRDRLMFPIIDKRGRICGFGGRVLGDAEPKYLNSAESDWFHKSTLLYGLHAHRQAIRQAKQVLVVEGYMDVLMLAAHDLPIAVAPLGTAISERQLKELFRLSPQPVFCFDGDRAGKQAAWRALERILPLLSHEAQARFMFLPDQEDPDSMIRQEGKAAFQQRIAQASDAIQFWLRGLKSMVAKGATGRAQMAAKADTMLASMSDHYLRQAWKQEIESFSGLSIRHRRMPMPELADTEEVLSPLYEQFISALLSQPHRFSLLPKGLDALFIDKPRYKEIYSRAFSYAGDTHKLLQTLMREFPHETRLGRWAAGEIDDKEFEQLRCTMEAQLIRQHMSNTDSLSEKLVLKKRLMDLDHRRRGS